MIREAQCRRKHPRDESFDPAESAQSAKRRKASSPSRYPPEFWDTLSKVHLTWDALREFDRRKQHHTSLLAVSAREPPTTRRILRSDARNLHRLAQAGGLDLSELRGYSIKPTTNVSMSSSSSRSRKRSHASSSKKGSTTTKTTNTGPYNRNFLQKLIDQGVYPDGYSSSEAARPRKPNNVKDIQEMLSRTRQSLSPSAFPETSFEDFQDSNRRVKSELQVTGSVIPFITGPKDRRFETTGNVDFNNLLNFDPSLTAPKPDAFYGAKAADVYSLVRDDLDKYITPSTDTSLPVVPNFFREDKSASGRADVAQIQAMHDGAVGARAIWHLQNYGNPTPEYDGNAYTITSTYHPGTGTLQLYTTHPGPPATASGNPQYYMNQLDTYAMTGNMNSFRAGAGAYRNAREWTKEQRDQFITDANDVVRRRSKDTRSFSRSVGDLQGSSATGEAGADEPSGSDTSVDELALHHDAFAKRQRRRTTR